jgi:hypothetical protein
LLFGEGAFDDYGDGDDAPVRLVDSPEPPREFRQNDDEGLTSSSAYPENLIQYRPPSDPVRYGVIDESGRVVRHDDGGAMCSLPALSDSDSEDAAISFVLVTDANALRLELLDGTGLDVSARVLQPDLQIDKSKLDPLGREGWASFRRTVRPNVRVKFLFTRQQPAG